MDKLTKNALEMTTGGVAMGVGAGVLSSVGSAKGAEGMANTSSFLPVAGTITGAGAVLGGLKKLKYQFAAR